MITDKDKKQLAKILSEGNEGVFESSNSPLGDMFAEMLAEMIHEGVLHVLRDPEVFQALVMDVANSIPDPQDGYTPTPEEITSLIEPLIPDPVKGDKGDPGKPGKDAEPLKITPEFMKSIAEKVEVTQENELTGEDIVSMINDLPTDKTRLKIDASHIKGLPKGKDSREGASLHRGGLKLVWNTVLDGTVNGSNTVFTIPTGLPDPKDDKYIVAARGVLKDEDSGDFTVSNNNRTVTFTSAPPNGSAQPRIPLYHGK